MTERLLHSNDRRVMLRALLALGAAYPLTRTVEADAKDTLIGIGLYSVRMELSRDFEGTLQALSAMGYREVEFLGLFGQDVRAVDGILRKCALRAPSAMVFSPAASDLLRQMSLGQLSVQEGWPKIDAAMRIEHLPSLVEGMFEQARVLRHKFLVASSIDAELLTSVSGVAEVARAFDTAARLCRARGLTFAFHPEIDAFRLVDGKTAMERILDATAASGVALELDLYWAALGGMDIPRVLNLYPGRVPLVHIKDMDKNYPLSARPAGSIVDKYHFEDVGHGQLDFKRWIPLARRNGTRHFFFERDMSADPLASARRSFASLRELL